MFIISARPAIASALAATHAASFGPATLLSPDGDWQIANTANLVVLDAAGLAHAYDRLSEISQIATMAHRLMFVSHASDVAASLAQRAGAHGILAEADSLPAWRDIFGRLGKGSFVVSAAFRNAPTIVPRLTQRQLEVYVLAARGRSDEEIASEMGTSISTAETHRRDTQQKLGCAGHRELLVHAIRHGIIDVVDVDLLPSTRRATRRHISDVVSA